MSLILDPRVTLSNTGLQDIQSGPSASYRDSLFAQDLSIERSSGMNGLVRCLHAFFQFFGGEFKKRSPV